MQLLNVFTGNSRAAAIFLYRLKRYFARCVWTFLNSFFGHIINATDWKFISLDACVLLVSKYISSFSVGIFFPKDISNLVTLNIFRNIFKKQNDRAMFSDFFEIVLWKKY